jgi:rhodanese-related sulfurtransferase
MEKDQGVTTDWVWQRIKNGEQLFFIELRHAGDVDLTLQKIRGALRVTQDNADKFFSEIPRGRMVVICSSAPTDEPAYLLARQLIQQGILACTLSGGVKAYLRAGLPVEEVVQSRNMTRIRGL